MSAEDLRWADRTRLGKFALVGISGVGVNTGFLWLFTEAVHLHYTLSSPLAVELAIVSNFLLNDRWTFRDAVGGSPLGARMLRFHVASAGGFVINYLFLVGLTELAGLYYLLSNLAGILAAFLWNYTVNVKWTWRRRPHPPR